MLLVGFGGRREASRSRGPRQDPHGLRFAEGSAVARDIGELHVGGVILYSQPASRDDSAPGGRNVQSPAQLAALVADLRRHSATSRARAGLEALPLLVAIDQEGGAVDRLPAQLGFRQRTFPARSFGEALELAARSPRDAERGLERAHGYARQMAWQLRSLGIDWNLAPCADVNLEPASPAIGARGRSFSADPQIVTELAWQFARGFREEGVLATLKHFPGHGSARADSHAGWVDVTQSSDPERELQPYRRLVERGYQDAILVGHLVNGRIDAAQCKPGRPVDPRTWCPASMSRVAVGLLRGELGFEGWIVADDLSMAAIAREFALDVALERAIEAGVELFIVGNHTSHATQTYVDTIAELLAAGRVDPAQIRRASDHVRALKKRREWGAVSSAAQDARAATPSEVLELDPIAHVARERDR